jgi:AP-2 complex subunit mu-1
MTYRISENINLPFKVVPVVQEYPDLNKLEYSVKLKAIFERTNFASNVVCKIPVPPNAANVKVYSAGTGKAKARPSEVCRAAVNKRWDAYRKDKMARRNIKAD